MDGPDYFGAIADLAKDVGAVNAQVNERVTYKELMAQNTQQRGEITSKIDKMEAHLSNNLQQSIAALNLRLDTVVQHIEALSQQRLAEAAQYRPSGNKAALSGVAGTVGAAIGFALYMLLRYMEIVP